VELLQSAVVVHTWNPAQDCLDESIHNPLEQHVDVGARQSLLLLHGLGGGGGNGHFCPTGTHRPFGQHCKLGSLQSGVVVHTWGPTLAQV